MFRVCVCVYLSCILLGIFLFRTTDETYGESKPRYFHNYSIVNRLQIVGINLGTNKQFFYFFILK